MASGPQFDPCREWLGVSALELEDPRKLLGLDPADADPIRILQAAEARLTRLRTVDAGPYEVARRALVTRVEEARDRMLALASQAMPQSPGSAAPAGGFAMPPPPPGTPVVDAWQHSAVPPPFPQAPYGDQQVFVRNAGPAYRPPSSNGPLFLLAGALLTAIAALALFALQPTPPEVARNDRQKESVSREKRQTEKRSSNRTPVKGAEGSVGQARTDAREPKRTGSSPRSTSMRRTDPGDTGISADTGGRGDGEEMPDDAPGGPSQERSASPVPEEEPEPASSPSRDPEEPITSKPVSDSPAPPSPGPTSPEPVSPGPASAKPEPEPTPPPTAPDDATAPPEEPDPLARIDEGVKACIKALSRQEFDAAERAMKPLASIAPDKHEANRVAGWLQLITYAKGFYAYREQAIDAMKPGNEFEVKSKRIGVIEVRPDEVIFKVAGQSKTWKRGDIPSAIVQVVVTSWFDDNPANQLYLGAYHFTKAEPDLAEAEACWSKGMIGGADASLLIPLLTDPVVVDSADSP